MIRCMFSHVTDCSKLLDVRSCDGYSKRRVTILLIVEARGSLKVKKLMKLIFSFCSLNKVSSSLTVLTLLYLIKCLDEVKPRDLVIYDRGGGYQSSKEVSEKEEEVEEENKSTFTILPRRQGSGTRFYSTLHLEHLRSLSSNQNFWYPEKSESRMGHKADSASVGCKVLPICDAVSTSSNGGDSSDGSDKDVHKGERRRAVSQMKELLKWAAAAKSHKGGRKGWKVKT